jgi:hypothetical protein
VLIPKENPTLLYIKDKNIPKAKQFRNDKNKKDERMKKDGQKNNKNMKIKKN